MASAGNGACDRKLLLGDIMESATVKTQRGLSAEQISVLIDSEFDASEALWLNSLGAESERQVWSAYHLIGDALRSDELVETHSESAFLANFSARLASEPHLLAPAALHADGGAARHNGFLRVRRVLPTAAAMAAVAMLSWVIIPRIQAPANGGGAGITVAQNSAPTSSPMRQVSAGGSAANEKASDLIVVRDARLDQYLAAHQQYAPYLVGQGVSPYVRASAQADQ